jgi:hypothetical protein
MRDKIALWIAIHLPVRIRYWVTMQMVGNAMMQVDILEEPITWSFLYDHMERPKESRNARSER